MADRDYEAQYWNQVVRKLAKGQEWDELLAEQYRRAYVGLLARWVTLNTRQTILKTDLFAEALCPSRAFLGDILKLNSKVVGIDISIEAALLARTRGARCAPDLSAQLAVCDIRRLPFAANSFDLIVSDSTLDHFHRKDDIGTALSELSRVLKPGGTLIITMDNKTNFTEPLFRIWIFLGLAPFFSGKTYSMRELKQALTIVKLSVIDTAAIIHQPRFFTAKLITLLHKVKPMRFNGWIRRSLILLDSLENRKTKYLTAQYIAAKATKPFT